MWHRASGVAESSVRGTLAVLFCAVLLALTMLFAAQTEAQETTAEQTVAQTKDATTVVKKVRETTAQANDATTGNATENENTVAQNRDTLVEEPEQAVQQGGQQAQADPTEDDGSQATARVADPLANAPAEITETIGDDDATIANRIVPSDVNCEVSEGATVAVRDADGTQIELIDGNNVNIAQRQTQIIIVGTADEDRNLNGVNASGEFGPSNGTETGRVIRSAGISCERDDDDANTGNAGGNNGNANSVEDGCTTLRLFEGDDQESGTFTVPDGASSRLRIVYSTLNEDGDLTITVGEVQTRTTGFSETIEGAESGVIREKVEPGEQGAVSVNPTDQDYRVVFEVIGGDEECTSPKNVRGVLAESIPDDELPATGGLPISVLAGCVALLLVGTGVVGTALRRRQ